MKRPGNANYHHLPLLALADEVRQLWRLACEKDGIDPCSMQAVFSDDNYWAECHSNATAVYLSRQTPRLHRRGLDGDAPDPIRRSALGDW